MIGGDGEVSGFSVECHVGTGIVLYSVEAVDVLFPSEDVQPLKLSSESSCCCVYIDFNNRGILFTNIVKNIFQCRTIQSFRTSFILKRLSRSHCSLRKNFEHVFPARLHSDASSFTFLHTTKRRSAPSAFRLLPSALVAHSVYFVRKHVPVLHHECWCTGGEGER